MSHAFRPGPVGLELNPVKLWAVVAIGASGAPTLTRGKGISSVVRNSAGKYTVTTPVATDPGNGDVIYFSIELSNSTVV